MKGFQSRGVFSGFISFKVDDIFGASFFSAWTAFYNRYIIYTFFYCVCSDWSDLNDLKDFIVGFKTNFGKHEVHGKHHINYFYSWLLYLFVRTRFWIFEDIYVCVSVYKYTMKIYISIYMYSILYIKFILYLEALQSKIAPKVMYVGKYFFLSV